MKKLLFLLLLVPALTYSQTANKVVVDSLRVSKQAIINDTLQCNYLITGKHLVLADSLRVGKDATFNDTTWFNYKVNLRAPVVISANALFTPDSMGIKLTLKAITAGDSVFGHIIWDRADSVVKIWNGSAWKTLVDAG